MKRFSFVLLVCAVAGIAAAADVLQQLRVTKEDAAREVIRSLSSGHVGYWSVREAFKSAAPAARAALVEQVLVWTKAYVGSPQFAKDYAAYREEAKPRATERKTTVDQELEAARKKRQADFDKAKKDIAQMPAEYRKAAEEGLKAAEQAQKQYDTAEFRKMERDSIVAQRKDEDDRYTAQLGKWEKELPADPKALVKSRIQQFLRETADVDYAAALNGRRFANPAYEKKSGEWKLAYRAGRETTEKARAFAQAWLTELR